MATKATVVLAALLTSGFVAEAPTWADTYQQPALMARADNALFDTLPVLFDHGYMESRTLPAFGGALHSLTLGELQINFTRRLSARAGAGLAAIVDAPADSRTPGTGYAVVGTVDYALLQGHGMRFAAEITAVSVSYGDMSFIDKTFLLAVTAKR